MGMCSCCSHRLPTGQVWHFAGIGRQGLHARDALMVGMSFTESRALMCGYIAPCMVARLAVHVPSFTMLLKGSDRAVSCKARVYHADATERGTLEGLGCGPAHTRVCPGQREAPGLDKSSGNSCSQLWESQIKPVGDFENSASPCACLPDPEVSDHPLVEGRGVCLQDLLYMSTSSNFLHLGGSPALQGESHLRSSSQDAGHGEHVCRRMGLQKAHIAVSEEIQSWSLEISGPTLLMYVYLPAEIYTL